jgi:hypothetical protein
MGCAGTKFTSFGSSGPMVVIANCFTDPTSETIAPGISAPAIAFVTPSYAPTGVQTITRSAPFTASVASIV